MDTIYIKGLRADAIIGIHDWEREVRQTLVLDLELGCDAARAASVDQIGYTVDYAAVARAVIDLVEASQYQLLETLAEQVANMLTRNFGVPSLRLQVSKPTAVDEADDVGVIIQRDRRQR